MKSFLLYLYSINQMTEKDFLLKSKSLMIEKRMFYYASGIMIISLDFKNFNDTHIL